MSARIIDGKAFAKALRARLAAEITQLTDRYGAAPGLAVVLVGEDPASRVYVRNKAQQTVEVGMRSIAHHLDAATSQPELLALIKSLNADPAVDGILVQLPLPAQIESQKVILAIDPAKDADGFHPMNVGLLATGGPSSGGPGLVPCTPLGCSMLIDDVLGPDIAGAHAVIIGRSNIVGKPMAQLLLNRNCTVTIAHSRTADLPGLCRSADILVAAVGRAEMVRGDWIKPGACVIDVGINRIDKPDGGTRLVGDVAFAEALAVAGSITPVPGGIGPMTIACLLHNTLAAAKRRRGWSA